MNDPRLARRYAHALFTVAEEHAVADEIDRQLVRFVELLEENRRFRDFLASPRIAASEKERFLRSVLDGLVHKALEEFVILLRRKGRFGLIDEVRGEYKKILDERYKRTSATVTTAVPLTDPERTRLRSVLQTRTGQEVELNEVVDPRVIGGASVVVLGQITDDTVRHHLDELRDSLRSIPVPMTPQEV